MKRKSLKYGLGLNEDSYEELVETLKIQLEKVAFDFYEKAFGVLVKHAKLIASCSKWQYRKLKKVLSLGRIRKIGDLLDKVQLYGSGLMAIHIAKNGGILAETFLALPFESQEKLNAGEVLIRRRGDVIAIASNKLTEKEMSVVVRSARSAEGAKILDPEEQHAPRPRRMPRYYVPVAMEADGDSVIVTFELDNSRFRGRFEQRHVVEFNKVARPTLRKQVG